VSARRVAALACATFCAAARAIAQQPVPTPVQESVTVHRVEITLHVTDRSGAPVQGMEPREFSVFVDGKHVDTESVEWVASAGDGTLVPTREVRAGGPEPEPPPPAPSGRLIVMVFQREIAGQKEEGLMRMKRQALDFVETLKPDDQVAILAMGARLWLRLDFTADRKAIRKAVGDATRAEDVVRVSDPPEPSIAARLASEDEERATSIEKAFLAIGRALKPLPGAKAVLFFGYGIGRWNALAPAGSGDYYQGNVIYPEEYERAREALSAAQAPVFTLDVSSGAHQLSEALHKLSFETGGFYVPTHQFPNWAMQRVAAAITGHYVLVIDKPALPPGLHKIEIVTIRRNVSLLYRQTYED
jgi:VWFA-related protein